MFDPTASLRKDLGNMAFQKREYARGLSGQLFGKVSVKPEMEWPSLFLDKTIYHGGFHKWGYPINGGYWCPKIQFNWMMTGGTPISGNTHMLSLSFEKSTANLVG